MGQSGGPRYPLYDGLPEFYGMHYNGTCHAYFCSANGPRAQGWFHIEDADGNRVKMEMNQHGHAYAILEALDRAEKAPPKPLVGADDEPTSDATVRGRA